MAENDKNYDRFYKPRLARVVDSSTSQTFGPITAVGTSDIVDVSGSPMRNWTLVVNGTLPAVIPPDPNTLLLLHADVDAPFIDSSLSARTVTTLGATLDAAVKVFGAGSVRIDSAGGEQNLSVPTSPDWAFGTGAFTVDFRVNVNSAFSSHCMFKIGDTLTTGPLGAWLTPTSLNLIIVGNAYSIPWSPTWNTWYHVAIAREATGGTTRVFVNGLQIGTDIVDAGNITQTGDVLIGAWHETGWTGWFFDGWFDEFRISDICRWTANFILPVAPYGGIGIITPPLYEIVLEGSVEGITFSEILKHTALIGLGENLYSGTTVFPASYYRLRTQQLITLGSYDSLSAQVLGTQ